MLQFALMKLKDDRRSNTQAEKIVRAGCGDGEHLGARYLSTVGRGRGMRGRIGESPGGR